MNKSNCSFSRIQKMNFYSHPNVLMIETSQIFKDKVAQNKEPPPSSPLCNPFSLQQPRHITPMNNRFFREQNDCSGFKSRGSNMAVLKIGHVS